MSWESLVADLPKGDLNIFSESDDRFRDFKEFVCFVDGMNSDQFDSAYEAGPELRRKFYATYADRLFYLHFGVSQKNKSQLYLHRLQPASREILVYSPKEDSVVRTIGVFEPSYTDRGLCNLSRITESTDSTLRIAYDCGCELFYHEPSDSVEVYVRDSVNVSYRVEHYKLNGDTVVRTYYHDNSNQ